MGIKIGYSTLACPDWTLEEAFERGSSYGYDALELGMIKGEFVTVRGISENLSQLKALSDTSGCRMMAIGSMVQLARDEPEERVAAVAEARSLLELGGELGIDFVRVFAGWLSSNPSTDWRLDVVTQGLEQLIDTAVSTDVKLALETHDVFSSSANVRRVLERMQSPCVVALWDVLHPCKVDETPHDVCTSLDGRIGYAHVKDAYRSGDAEGWTPVSMGQGDVPVKEAVQLLYHGSFDGYYVVEYEKGNHRDLVEPEVSLPMEIATLKEYLI